jgi:hypothetical protein
LGLGGGLAVAAAAIGAGSFKIKNLKLQLF